MSGDAYSDDQVHDMWAAETSDTTRKALRAPSNGRRAQMVQGYHDARHAAEIAREDVAMGYATETREYNRDQGMLTFKTWLKSNRGSGQQ